MNSTNISIDTSSLSSYKSFLTIKNLPRYRFQGRIAIIPSEYCEWLGLTPPPSTTLTYEPPSFLYDYQAEIAQLSVRKQKFAVFLRCGRGKNLIKLDFARHSQQAIGAGCRVLIVEPLMVIGQTIAEARRFYGDDLAIERVAAADLAAWTAGLTGKPGHIGITNYEAITDEITQGIVGSLILDESSMLKSAYGKWGNRLVDIGRGLEWKLCLTGTPAPNDRIEYSLHAVFLDAFPTVNSFLARFFINRGETQNRWELKPHALRSFYRALSDWCIFVDDPATYGWKDNAGTLPPIIVHIHDVELTDNQNDLLRKASGTLIPMAAGGIVGRSKAARIAKGGDSLKAAFIRSLVESWPDESTIIWCKFNDEQDRLAKEMPDAGSIAGKTPMIERARIIAEFQAGRIKTLISKPEVAGFGLNFQIATRHIFSTLHDSYEDYFQCVCRSNRVGSTRPLSVHIPLTEAERPMAETVLRKAAMVDADIREQEEIFRATR